MEFLDKFTVEILEVVLLEELLSELRLQFMVKLLKKLPVEHLQEFTMKLLRRIAGETPRKVPEETYIRIPRGTTEIRVVFLSRISSGTITGIFSKTID